MWRAYLKMWKQTWYHQHKKKQVKCTVQCHHNYSKPRVLHEDSSEQLRFNMAE